MAQLLSVHERCSKKINKGSDNYRMCYDNFPKRDERSHYSDTRQKRAGAVFRQTGNNLGAVLETAVTGCVQVRRRACKEKEVGRAEPREGGNRPLAEMVFFRKQMHNAFKQITRPVKLFSGAVAVVACGDLCRTQRTF